MTSEETGTYMADELNRVYAALEDAAKGAETQRENAVLGLMFILTDYGRNVALQREYPTPSQKLGAEIIGEMDEKPNDPGFWPDYAGDHDDYSDLVDWTDPEGPYGE